MATSDILPCVVSRVPLKGELLLDDDAGLSCFTLVGRKLVRGRLGDAIFYLPEAF